MDWCLRGRSRRWVGAFRRRRCALQEVSLRSKEPRCLPRSRQYGDRCWNNAALLTLVFPVASLNFLVHTLLYFPLQDSCPGRLVVVGNLQDVGGIYVMVSPPAHDMVSLDIELEHWDLMDARVRVLICVVTTMDE